MKKLMLVFNVFLSYFSVQAQVISPVVISPAGGFASNANGSYSFTIGEMTMVKTFSNQNNILTQGFQQPSSFPEGLLDLTHDEFGSFAAYPVPAVDKVWFGFEFAEEGRVSVSLFDLLGQKVSDVYSGNYENGKTIEQVNVSRFAAGVYFLTMTFTSTVDGNAHVSSKKLQVVN